MCSTLFFMNKRTIKNLSKTSDKEMRNSSIILNCSFSSKLLSLSFWNHCCNVLVQHKKLNLRWMCVRTNDSVCWIFIQNTDKFVTFGQVLEMAVQFCITIVSGQPRGFNKHEGSNYCTFILEREYTFSLPIKCKYVCKNWIHSDVWIVFGWSNMQQDFLEMK
jgi:hypothetical protein